MTHRLICGDCLDVIPTLGEKVDLVFCSPPYEAARTYGELDFSLQGQEWVDWAVERFMACLSVCTGLVAWVIEGRTRQYRYSATPALFMADLHRRGVHLRHPCAYVRGGISGSGGPDWLRNRWETVVCATNGGKLPWSDNTACGQPPKFGPGGPPSHRRTDGTRVNGSRCSDRRPNGELKPRIYVPPKIANPANWLEFPDDGIGVDCGPCGGGHLGDEIAHENEAPFPEKLVEFFVKSFCPPGGTVLDCFSGSGTTVAVATKNGRNGIGIDVRQSQIDIAQRRLDAIDARTPLFTGVSP